MIKIILIGKKCYKKFQRTFMQTTKQGYKYLVRDKGLIQVKRYYPNNGMQDLKEYVLGSAIKLGYKIVSNKIEDDVEGFELRSNNFALIVTIGKYSITTTSYLIGKYDTHVHSEVLAKLNQAHAKYIEISLGL